MKLPLACTMVLAAAPVLAETVIMSAPEALAAVQTGEMTLIDIRSPEEWAETGVAQGAIALTMHSQDFGSKLAALFAAAPTPTFGLICATGGRSNYVATVLEQNGMTGILDVSEGMLGNGRASGWLARGLPLDTAETATNAYNEAILK